MVLLFMVFVSEELMVLRCSTAAKPINQEELALSRIDGELAIGLLFIDSLL